MSSLCLIRLESLFLTILLADVSSGLISSSLLESLFFEASDEELELPESLDEEFFSSSLLEEELLLSDPED